MKMWKYKVGFTSFQDSTLWRWKEKYGQPTATDSHTSVIDEKDENNGESPANSVLYEAKCMLNELK